jgi:2,5-diketo-D-gluconate reductase A
VLSRLTVRAIAEQHGKTPAQVVQRWHIELGFVPIPRSSNRERLVQNLEIFDSSLTPDDTQALAALDRGESAATDSDKTGH